MQTVVFYVKIKYSVFRNDMENSFDERVEQALEEVRPMLKIHAGSVELVSASKETGVVVVRLLGTCNGCELADMTLKMGIEVMLKERIPEVTSVKRL